jgi:hypothetical protein
VDQTGAGRLRVEWNRLMMKKLIGPAYCTLISKLSEIADANTLTEYFKHWPLMLQQSADASDLITRGPFQELQLAMAYQLQDLPVLFSEVYSRLYSVWRDLFF